MFQAAEMVNRIAEYLPVNPLTVKQKSSHILSTGLFYEPNPTIEILELSFKCVHSYFVCLLEPEFSAQNYI